MTGPRHVYAVGDFAGNGQVVEGSEVENMGDVFLEPLKNRVVKSKALLRDVAGNEKTGSPDRTPSQPNAIPLRGLSRSEKDGPAVQTAAQDRLRPFS